ncbi:MAG: RES domain-containing protein [Gemmatimonadales bacterium]
MIATTPPARDFRLQVFLVLLGTGGVAHVAQFMSRQQQRVGTFLDYVTRWQEVFPLGDPFATPTVAVGLHLAFLALSVGMIVSRYRLTLATALGAVGVPIMFVSPGRVSNHYIVLLVACLACALGLVADAFVRRRWAANSRDSARAAITQALLIVLRDVMIVTYLFAFLHKLNDAWLNPGTNESSHFVLAYLKPVLPLLGGAAEAVTQAATAIAVYIPLVLELALPLLLLGARTRILGAAAGVTFHLLMMGRDILDYPALILAFYPLFFPEEDLRRHLRDGLRGVTPGKMFAALALCAYVTYVWRPVSGIRWSSPLALFETTTGYALIAGWAYVLVGLVWRLLGRGASTRVVDDRRQRRLAGLPAIRRASAGERVALPDERPWLSWEEFSQQIQHQTRYLFFPDSPGDPYEESLPSARVLHQLGNLVNRFGLVRVIPAEQDFTRVRVHKSPIPPDDFPELAPPPEHHARFPSRVSPAGISVLYAAGSFDTAVAETFDPKRGPAVASAVIVRSMRPLHVLSLVDVPAVPGGFAAPEAEGNQLVLHFLREFARAVSEPIVKDGREHIEYCPTQVVTEFFRHRYRGPSGDRLDGIRYSSSSDPGGENYVFFFGNDDFFPRHGRAKAPFACRVHPEPHRSLSVGE